MEGFLSYFIMRGCPTIVWDERQRCDNGLQYDIMNTIQRTAAPTFSAFVPLFLFCALNANFRGASDSKSGSGGEHSV